MPNRLKALLLVNVGTPDQPTPPCVKKYLGEFLMDPYVVDIPAPLRAILVHGFILPKRPAVSAEAYRKIWTDSGSPLLVHSQKLAVQVQQRLGDEWGVQVAMRYGNPSIESVFDQLSKKDISEIVIFPLYPQYSLAATESSVQKCLKNARKMLSHATLKIVQPFFSSEPFISSFANVASASLENYPYDFMLFSFHGLPERQIRKTDGSGKHCLSNEACCETLTEANRDCYRAQCHVTARLLAKRLGIPPEKYRIGFQSRLGRTPWIKPYTDVVFGELARSGVKRLAVVCPAFVADCLETLEEIGIRGRNDFIRMGGEDLRLVPSLNSAEVWAKGVVDLVLTSKEQVE